jgi:phosphoglycerol transferase MdoB-like AlkP superfamily enzyme
VQNHEKPPATNDAARFSLKAAVPAVLSVSLIFLGWFMDRASINVALFAYGWSYGFFVNALPVVLVFLLLLVVFNRLWLAYGTALFVTATLYAINHLKLKYLHVPISFSDVYLLDNLHLATLKLLSEYVSAWHILIALLVVVALIGSALKFGKPWFKRRSAMRALTAAMVVAAMAGIAAGSDWVAAVYNPHRLRLVPFSPLLTQVHGGLLSSVLYSDAERKRSQTITVDRHAVQTLLALNAEPAHPRPAITYAQPPDIVVVQSESFFDPAIIKGISDTSSILPNLHRALAAGVGGTMDPPTFGGGTLRTEFEVLTGIPMAAYPDMEFPYLQINQPSIPSFVRVAGKAGYTTTAIHANSGAFWNRNVAFREIGFQRFITEADFSTDANRDGWYLSDAAMTDKIIATLNRAKSPALIFAISIEAHGPYLNDPVGQPAVRDVIPVPPGLPEKAALEYRNYMYHIADADRQFGRLWDFLVARHRPFVLVFYGDHLPALTHFYSATGFDDGASGPDQFVPWVIVGSAAKQQSMHIHSWGVGAEILRMAGLPLPPYFRMLAQARCSLIRHPDPAHQDEILQGVYSLARLHLNGRDGEFLKAASARGADHAVVTTDP